MKTTASQRWLVCFLAFFLLAVGGCTKEGRIQRRLERAEAYFQDKNYDSARIEYLNVWRLSQTNATAIVRLGEIFYAQRAYAQAEPFLVRTVELQPGNLEARERLAQIHLGARRVDKARAEALTILERRPGHETALLIYSGTAQTPEELAETEQKLAELRQKAGDSAPFYLAYSNLQVQRRDLEGAEASIRQALELDPKSERGHLARASLYWLQNRLEEANAAFDAAGKLALPDSPTWMRIAQFKSRTGRTAEAKQVLEQITKDTPEVAAAWHLRGEIALAEKQYDECAAFVVKALDHDQDNYEALSLRARLNLGQTRFPEAVAELERLTTLYPRSGEALYHLGLAQLLNKQSDAAVASLERAIRLDPNQANAVLLLAELQLARRNPATTISLLTELLRRAPRLDQAHYLLARAYRAANRPDQAIEIYQALRKASPEDARAAYELGQVHQAQGRTAEARKAYELALKAQPDSAVLVYRLVELDLLDKEYAAATRRIQAQLARDTNSAPARLLEARVYGAQGMTNQVEAALRQAIATDPSLDEPYLWLAQLYLASGRASAALEQLHTSLEGNTNNLAALSLIGMIHSTAGAYELARGAYERALGVDSNAPLVLNNLAYLLSDRFEEHDRAHSYAARARQLRPDNPAFADTLGWIQFQRGQYAEAYALLAESASKLEAVGEAQFHFGMAAYMMGKEAEARTALTSALKATDSFSGKETIASRMSVLDADASQSDSKLLALLEEQTRTWKDDVMAWIRLAEVHERDGAFDRARGAYEAALKVNPAATTFAARLALLYARRLNEPAKALRLAQDARKRAPNDPELLHALGMVGLQSGDSAWAYGLLQEAARSQPDRIEIQSDLAWAAFSLGRLSEAEQTMQAVAGGAAPAQLAEAAEWFVAMVALVRQPEKLTAAEMQIQAVLQAVPDHGPAQMALALLREQQGNLTEARTLYDRLLARYPGFSPAVRQLAILLADQGGDDARAYELASKARTALPGDEFVAKALGKLAYRRADYPYAARLLHESAQQRTRDADIFFHLGMACLQLKQTQQGRTALETAVQLDPDAPFAAEARRTLEQNKGD